MTSAEAVVVPEDSAGGLVRTLGRSAQEDPDSWVAVITDLRGEGLVLTVTVNGEMLDDAIDIPDGLWWGFMIECWARIPASTLEEVEDSLVRVGVGALNTGLERAHHRLRRLPALDRGSPRGRQCERSGQPIRTQPREQDALHQSLRRLLLGMRPQLRGTIRPDRCLGSLKCTTGSPCQP